MCLFKYFMVIFLVMPGKTSFRHFDQCWPVFFLGHAWKNKFQALGSVLAYGIGRALLEKSHQGAAKNKHIMTLILRQC